MDYDLDPRAVERAFNSAPTMGFTLGTTKDLGIKGRKGPKCGSWLWTGRTLAFPAVTLSLSASLYLRLGKEDFKGREGADPLIERYLSLDLTWDFLDPNDADLPRIRDAGQILRCSPCRIGQS